MKIRINLARLAFPNLFHPKSFDGDDAKADYNAAFILEGEHADAPRIIAAMEKVGAEKWGAKWPGVKKELALKDRFALHDGDTKPNLLGYAGNQFINARNKVRPLVIDSDKSPLTERDGRIYSGCYVNASIELWAQDNQYGKRINATLLGVQFAKDGEPFSGGGTGSEDDFDEVDASADDLV